MKRPHIGAAITGDIIASQELSPKEQSQLATQIVSAGKQLKKEHSFALAGDVDVFRGESWQFYCDQAEHALTAALFFRAYLLGYHNLETRFSIGIGRVEKIVPERISTSQGEAFVLSGHHLDKMPSYRTIAIATSAPSSEAEYYLDAICSSIDASSTGWTQKQALAIALNSTGNSNEKSAEQWPEKPISKQAFGKHLANAQWDLINHSLKQTNIALKQTLDRL